MRALEAPDGALGTSATQRDWRLLTAIDRVVHYWSDLPAQEQVDHIRMLLDARWEVGDE